MFVCVGAYRYSACTLRTGPKMQHFILANIRHICYRTLEFVTLYHFRVQIVKFSTRKTCFNQNHGKMYLQIIVT